MPQNCNTLWLRLNRWIGPGIGTARSPAFLLNQGARAASIDTLLDHLSSQLADPFRAFFKRPIDVSIKQQSTETRKNLVLARATVATEIIWRQFATNTTFAESTGAAIPQRQKCFKTNLFSAVIECLKQSIHNLWIAKTVLLAEKTNRFDLRLDFRRTRLTR